MCADGNELSSVQLLLTCSVVSFIGEFSLIIFFDCNNYGWVLLVELITVVHVIFVFVH